MAGVWQRMATGPTDANLKRLMGPYEMVEGQTPLDVKPEMVRPSAFSYHHSFNVSIPSSASSSPIVRRVCKVSKAASSSIF